MKRFQFRLQTVLDLKEKREESVQLELAVLETERRAEADCLEALNGRQAEGKEYLRSRLRGTWAAEEVSQTYAYLDGLAGQIKRQKETLRLATERVARKREELLEATKERKALERLRDIARENHMERCLKENQKKSEEFSILRYEHNDQFAGSASSGEGKS